MNIFKKLPGFRSNKKRNKIIASLYYGIFLLSLISVFPQIAETACVIMFLLFPLLIFNIIEVIKNKEGLFSKKGKIKILSPLIAIVVSFFIIGITAEPQSNIESQTSSNNTLTNNKEVSIVKDSNKLLEEDNSLTVDNVTNNTLAENNKIYDAEIHFINTGNSDAILVKQSGEFALIDGGDNNDENMIVSYLKKQGVSKLKYVFSTHGDADHCGGLDAVIDAFDIENVFIANGDVNTKTYTDFINSVANKGLFPSVPLLGTEFNLGTSTFKVVSVANTNDINNNSLVLLYTNGNDKILLTGDADTSILNKIDVGDIDLLKVGHHGSKTSTDQSFLNKVNPEYAVILCGENNRYGHPHKEVMDLLKSNNIEVHRTDECGTIVFKSTGKGLEVDCKGGSYNYGKTSTSSSSSNSSTSNSTSNTVNSNSESNSSSSSNTNSTNNKSETNSSSSSTNNSSSNNNSSTSSTDNNVSNSSNSRTVYWTTSGKKYHFSPTCSNMKNPMSGTIEESGRTPCSKCAH